MPAAGSGWSATSARQLTAVEHRPPLALASRVGTVPGRAGSAICGATRDWVLYWRDRHRRFACMASLSHHRASATCCARLTDLIAIFWGQGRPGWGVRTAQPRYLAVPLPAKACPAPCSLGHEQFRDLTSCARLSPAPGDRGLADVALAGLAMTRLRPLGPTKASTGYPTCF
jgi:hypothetical protein